MLISSLNKEELDEAAFITKLISTRWNETIHHNGFSHHNSIVTKAREELLLFKSFQTWLSNTARSQTNMRDWWQKSPLGCFKVNWDEVYDQHKRKYSFGVIIWNCECLVIGTLRATKSFNNDHFIDEVCALIVVVHFCKEASFQSTVLGGDALQVVFVEKKVKMNGAKGALWFKMPDRFLIHLLFGL